MPRRREYFGDHDTCTKEKLEVEAWHDSFLRPFIGRKLNQKPAQQAFVLVGAISGIERHITRLVGLGFAMENIVIVERNQRLSQEQAAFCRDHRFTCRTLCGEMSNIVYDAARSGEEILYVEHDGTSSYGNEFETMAFGMFRMANLLKIPALVVMGVARTQPVWLKEWAKEMGVRKERYQQRSLGKRFPLQSLAIAAASREMSRYLHQFRTYQGVCCMYAHAFRRIR